MNKKLRYLPLASKILFLVFTAVNLYRYRDLLYRFCLYPFPFIMCPKCEYPCFFRAARLQEIIVAGATVSGLVSGRVFCGALCPVGTIQDWLQSFRQRVCSLFSYLIRLVFPSKDSVSNDTTPKAGKTQEGILGRGLGKGLRLLKYPIIMVVSLYGLIRFALGFDIMPDWGLLPALNFASAIRRVAGPEYIHFGMFFLVMVLGVGLIWHRPWCKYLCPYGLLFAVFNKVSFLKIKMAKKGCTGCRECLNGCTTGKPINKLEKGFTSVECVRCYNCVLACPEGEVKVASRFDRVGKS